MGLFKRFSAPKATIEVKLNEAVYNYTDKLTGRIAIEPQEEISLDGIRLELRATKKVKWKQGMRSFNTGSSLETRKIPLAGSIKLYKGQHYEQEFQVNIPFYSRADPFTDIELKVKGVAAIQGRPDLTHEIQPGVIFPYSVECLREYGGYGYITQPAPTPIAVCPRCGHNLEEVWNRKYSDELNRGLQKTGMPRDF